MHLHHQTTRPLAVLAVAFGLCSIAAPGSAAPQAPAQPKLDVRARVALESIRSGMTTAETEARGFAVNAAGELDVFIVGSVSRQEVEQAGATVRTALNGVLTAYVPAAAVERISSLPGVARICGAARVEPALDVSVPSTGTTSLRGSGPEFDGANGAGVVVGAVDSGIDVDHEDFDNPDGTTRIAAIWDQTNPAGPSPGGFALGTEWTSSQIDAGLVGPLDTLRHGTHVMGIAAGDGSGTGGAVPAFTYVGMAPRAHIVMVKTDFRSTTRIVDGVQYIFDVAASMGRNAVANLSLGYRLGPHDGTSPFELAMNALAGPGRIIVAASHNWRQLATHAEVLATSPQDSATIIVAGTGGGYFIADGYYDVSERLAFTVTSPNGIVIGPIGFDMENATYPGAVTPDGQIYVFNGLSGSYSTVHPEVYLEVRNITGTNVNGTWTLTFTPVVTTGFLGEVDLWLVNDTISASFDVGNQPLQERVSEPGNAPEVITVGGFSTREFYYSCNGDSITNPADASAPGTLYQRSNPGPTRDGRLKPEISAPAVWIGAATSFDLSTSCPPPGSFPTSYLPDGMQHRMGAGTSMATAHVAGAVALILQHGGSRTPDEIKSYLAGSATVDAFTGVVPNPDWGFGKLHVGMVTAADPWTRSAPLQVWPTPSSGRVEIAFHLGAAEPAVIRVFDVRGRLLRTLSGQHQWRAGENRLTWDGRGADGTAVPSGVYVVRLESGQHGWSRKVVLRR